MYVRTYVLRIYIPQAHGRGKDLAAPLVDQDGQVAREVDLHLGASLRHLFHTDLRFVGKQLSDRLLAARNTARRAVSRRGALRAARAGLRARACALGAPCGERT